MTPISVDLSPLSPADLPNIDKLDERAFGPGRFARTAYRPVSYTHLDVYKRQV